jgi:hypothetical protein
LRSPHNLALIRQSPQQWGVEDWEEFFVEKSRRRAEKVRGRSSKKWIRRGIAAWFFLLIIVVMMLVER